jgi:PHD/YefM family antitoxin component YafN of YafNO toxin-antitoxin module
MGDLKTRAKQTIEKAQEKPVYLMRDGEPVAGIVSLAMLELLYEALEERYITAVAQQRLKAVRAGDDELLEEEDFWAQADAIMANRK